jgi:hypothetical protein
MVSNAMTSGKPMQKEDGNKRILLPSEISRFILGLNYRGNTGMLGAVPSGDLFTK